MNRLLFLVLLFPLTVLAQFPYYRFGTIDISKPNDQFLIDRVYIGNTPYLSHSVTDNSQDVTNLSAQGWTFYLFFSESQSVAEGVTIPQASVSSNVVYYNVSTSVFWRAGDYYCSIYATSGQLKRTFAQGLLQQAADPAIDNPTAMSGSVAINWSTKGPYTATATHGPYRAGAGVSFTTNIDGSVNIISTSAVASAAFSALTGDPYDNAPLGTNLAQRPTGAAVTGILTSAYMTGAQVTGVLSGVTVSYGVASNTAYRGDNGGYVSNLAAGALSLAQNASGGVASLRGSMPTNSGGSIYVSSTLGSDSTGAPYDIAHPYRTITAAQSAASAGETVCILPGVYSDTGLGRDGLSYWFSPGSGVAITGSYGVVNIFSDGGTGMTFGVYGSGVFNLSPSAITGTSAIVYEGGPSRIVFECDSAFVGHTSAGMFGTVAYCTNGQIDITAKQASCTNSGGGGTLQSSGANVMRCHIGYASCIADVVFEADGNCTLYATADMAYSATNACLATTYGSPTMFADIKTIIASNGTSYAAIYTAAGTQTVNSSYIKNINGNAIRQSGGTLNLCNAALYANSNAYIGTASAKKQFNAYNCSYSNAAVSPIFAQAFGSSMFVNLIGGSWSTTNTVVYSITASKPTITFASPDTMRSAVFATNAIYSYGYSLNGSNVIAGTISSNAMDAATDAAYRSGYGGGITSIAATNADFGVYNGGGPVAMIGTNDPDAITHSGAALTNINMAGYSISNAATLTVTNSAQIGGVVFNGAGGISNVASIGWTNCSYVYAYSTNAFTVANTAAVTQTFGIEVEDRLAEFAPGTGIFASRNDGDYQVSYVGMWQAVDNAKDYQTRVNVDGASIIFWWYDGPAVASYMPITFSLTMHLSSTSQLSIAHFQNSGGSESVGLNNASVRSSSLTIKRLP